MLLSKCIEKYRHKSRLIKVCTEIHHSIAVPEQTYRKELETFRVEWNVNVSGTHIITLELTYYIPRMWWHRVSKLSRTKTKPKKRATINNSYLLVSSLRSDVTTSHSQDDSLLCELGNRQQQSATQGLTCTGPVEHRVSNAGPFATLPATNYY